MSAVFPAGSVAAQLHSIARRDLAGTLCAGGSNANGYDSFVYSMVSVTLSSSDAVFSTFATNSTRSPTFALRVDWVGPFVARSATR